MMMSDPTKQWDAIIFDLDGTLIDSAPDIQSSINAVLGDDDLPPLSLPVVTSFIGNGISHLVSQAYQHHGKILDVTELMDRTSRFSDVYANNANRQTQAFPGVMEAVRHLFDEGVKLGICTNKPALLAEKILVGLHLRTLFDAVIGGDSCKTRKPHPEPLLACCDALHADRDRCLYVGDSETDVRAARSAGLTVMLVTYGYTNLPVETLGADSLLTSLRELQPSGPVVAADAR